ncbi:MAG TPA: arginine--tRNA ligase [Thermodesulfobacteriota bacterium]|nr:arginine--tRNA ligase [Thermodesulfobacteriota bacterium]
MNEVTRAIAEFVSRETGLSLEEVETGIEIPRDPRWGDYAFPCFSLAKVKRKSPQALAQEIARKFQAERFLTHCTPEGAYINFRIRREAWAEIILKRVLGGKEDYGRSQEGKGRTILVEFSSPNIAKPFHVGHLRSTIIGNSLCEIFERLGYGVIRLNHLGDWGKQFGEVITGFKHWGSPKQLEDHPLRHLFEVYSRFHSESETHPELHEEARAWFKKLEEGEHEAGQLWERFRKISIEEFKRLYSFLGVSFDSYDGESFYQNRLPELVERLRNSGLLVESQGAWIVPLEDYDLPPALILKKDEATLYLTRDIAAAEYRFQRWSFEKLIYVVGAPQKLHFQQLFKVLQLMGYDWNRRMVHVDFGHVLGMSTRRGEVIFLQDVIDEAVQRAERVIEERGEDKEARIGKISEGERKRIARAVGLGAIIFNDLRTRRSKDVEFDWDRILGFEGATGPYCQNAHVRCCGILRKYTGEVTDEADFTVLSSDEEFDLIKRLEELPEITRRAAREYEPSVVAGFMLDLAMGLNVFLARHRVLGEEDRVTRARILLIQGIKTVLSACLKMLGMEVLERM